MPGPFPLSTHLPLPATGVDIERRPSSETPDDAERRTEEVLITGGTDINHNLFTLPDRSRMPIQLHDASPAIPIGVQSIYYRSAVKKFR